MSMLHLAAFASNLGIMSVEIFNGWTSPALPLYDKDDSPVKISKDEAAWIVALLALGAAVGPIFTTVAADKIGRKILMLSTAVPSIISWIIIIFATTPWELYVSRFLSGAGAGVLFMIAPLYLGEISPTKIRGFLLTSIMIASRVGILFAYSLVPFVSIRMSSIISMIIAIVFALSIIWLPESPYYLLKNDRTDAARRALSLMRPEEDIERELKIIEASIKAETSHPGGFRELLRVKGNRTALYVSVTLVVIQQLSGVQTIISYSESIFDEASTKLDGKSMNIIFGIIQVICTGFCAVVVDRYGRRILLLISAIGSGLSAGLVAIYFNLKYINSGISHIEWLPATGCILFIVFFSVGLAGLPYTMLGELFPMNVKALGSSVATVIYNLVAFGIMRSYEMIKKDFGAHTAFWLYCGFNCVGAVYIYFKVPETRNKTLQEIQIILNTKNGYKE